MTEEQAPSVVNTALAAASDANASRNMMTRQVLIIPATSSYNQQKHATIRTAGVRSNVRSLMMLVILRCKVTGTEKQDAHQPHKYQTEDALRTLYKSDSEQEVDALCRTIPLSYPPFELGSDVAAALRKPQPASAISFWNRLSNKYSDSEGSEESRDLLHKQKQETRANSRSTDITSNHGVADEPTYGARGAGSLFKASRAQESLNAQDTPTSGKGRRGNANLNEQLQGLFRDHSTANIKGRKEIIKDYVADGDTKEEAKRKAIEETRRRFTYD
ncbi:hypothetical protein L202_04395 [Cryptococcus amylolentus CBS 6039]|uniref:Uncharacterized protein n=2 Tax=Cryptococcus amylolentus TaxID=104669 RepID=A0A1E3HR86_9TREE|nr:hypothetical protein L202_04395 [Cryptococcus amylolentus CBS 6039]ODN78854.1 hypothetical protein L202_04395 [Cryptococcus amylolentus CBS 6039]ODO06666.1 hypothetical protein I350_04024 [Cryptococcus amylolentus CBS 6273]